MLTVIIIMNLMIYKHEYDCDAGVMIISSFIQVSALTQEHYEALSEVNHATNMLVSTADITHPTPIASALHTA